MASMENIITASQIRSELKRWDGWWNKISTTQALLDRTYALIPLDTLHPDIETVRASWGLFAYIGDGASDCDNFALWLQADMQKLWAVKNKSVYEPAIFRIVIAGSPPHSINLAFTDKGMRYIEPQDGNIFWNEEIKILAVT